MTPVGAVFLVVVLVACLGYAKLQKVRERAACELCVAKVPHAHGPCRRAGEAAVSTATWTAIVDLAGFVSDYTGDLERLDDGRQRGQCPFHFDDGESLHVAADNRTWRCDGCDVGGDVVEFMRRAEGLTRAEAVERVAAIAGVPL